MKFALLPRIYFTIVNIFVVLFITMLAVSIQCFRRIMARIMKKQSPP